MQRGCGEGDWEIFGESLHRWKGEAEAKKAGQILFFKFLDLIVNFVSQHKLFVLFTFLVLNMDVLFLANTICP